MKQSGSSVKSRNSVFAPIYTLSRTSKSNAARWTMVLAKTKRLRSFLERCIKFKVNDSCSMNDLAFENNQPVLIDHFDHSIMDSPESVMREKLAMNVSAFDICESYLKDRDRDRSLEIIRSFIALISVEKRPLYFLDQLVWLSGLASKNGISLPMLAKKHGVSKQAFEQASNRTNVNFNFPKTSAQRTEEARCNMRKAYRANKITYERTANNSNGKHNTNQPHTA